MRILEGKLMRYFSGMVDSPIEVCLAIELIKSSSPSKLREASRIVEIRSYKEKIKSKQ